MKSYKQRHVKHESCLVLRPKVQNFIINTPNSLASGTSKGTDKTGKQALAKVTISLVASIVLGVPIPVRGIPAPESERTLILSHVTSKN
jgi:hypothetical protein